MSVDEPQGKLDQFFLLSQDLFCCIDFAGKLLSVNPRFETLLGYEAASLLGKPCGVVVEPRDHPAIEEALARLCRGEKIEAFAVCAVTADGRRVWIEVTASTGDQVIYVIARDITQRKAVEKQLRRNQRLFRIAGETAHIGGWYVDTVNNVPVWSDELCHIHGMPAGFQPSTDEAFAFYAPTSRERLKRDFQACAAEGVSFDGEYEVITRQGQRRWVRAIGRAVRDEQGQIIQVQGSSQDITQRKATERQLTLLERSVESSTNGVVIVDAQQPDLPMVYVNSAFERITGYSRDAALGRNCRFLQGEETDSATLALLRKGIQEQRDVHVVIRNYRRNGAPFWNDLYISPCAMRGVWSPTSSALKTILPLSASIRPS